MHYYRIISWFQLLIHMLYQHPRLFLRLRLHRRFFENIDWMHETARCFEYPSDSTRTARERAREATCGHRLRQPGPVRPGPGLLLAPIQAATTPAPVAHLPAAPRAPRWLNSSLRRPSPLWIIYSPRCISPLWLNSGRRRAPPTSHWSWVSSRAAGRGAGSPARIATVVLTGVQWGGLGLALPGADRRLHRASRGPGDARSRPSHVRG